MAMPQVSSGAATTLCTLLAAETAATALAPRPLTAPCRMMLPMAVMENCRPMGMPMAAM